MRGTVLDRQESEDVAKALRQYIQDHPEEEEFNARLRVTAKRCDMYTHHVEQKRQAKYA